MHKKIAIIGTVGLPAKYGGFETLTEYLTRQLSSDFDITVYCSSVFYNEKLDTHNGAHLKYIRLNANGVQSIVYDIISVFNALCFADTLLILGVSGCGVLPFVRLFSKKKIIVNIDGLEWKRAKWGKAAKWFLKYSEKLAVRHADEVIADNKVIQEYVEKTYGKKAELIAYGADHSEKEGLTKEVRATYPFLSKPYAFKVCRIEPENNVHLILEAFSEHPAMHMVFVGNWDNSTYGKELKLQFQSFKNIYMLDPIYDQGILNQLRSNCYVYMHGHSAGGTNPSLVEAMHLELPIIAYDVNYNRETTDNKALYFKSKMDLIQNLKSLNKNEISKMGIEMKNIANERYTWNIIAKKYAKVLSQI
jgi:glycosyltransferase involved in cell wall biosynthesis